MVIATTEIAPHIETLLKQKQQEELGEGKYEFSLQSIFVLNSK
jgi:hypothetical protein